MGVHIDQDGNLVIDGVTGPRANVTVNAIDPSNVQVSVNGVNRPGPWDLSGGGRVIVFGSPQGGNYLQVQGPVSTEIHGGSGDDTVMGGDKDDVVFAEGGNNTVTTHSDRSLVLGGPGRQSLQCSGNVSVQVAGTIDPSAADPITGETIKSYAYLKEALDAWAAGDQSRLQTIVQACAARIGSFLDFSSLTGGRGPAAFVCHYQGAGTRDTITNFNPGKGDVRYNI